MADPDPSKIKHGGTNEPESSMSSLRWTLPPQLAGGRDGVVGSDHIMRVDAGLDLP
jgi:hypothetical protein